MYSGARMSALRVCIDARLGSGQFGGVQQVVIGVASGLSRLRDSDEEYLFLTHPEHEDWLLPYLGGPCRVLHPRHSYARRRARAIGKALIERIPAVGPRYSVRGSDGTIEAAGVDVVHFPFQDAFTTEIPSLYQPHDLQHLHLPELFSRWHYERRERIYRTHCERAAGGGDDDLLGPPRLHRELRPPGGQGVGRAGRLRPPGVPGAERGGPRGDPLAALATRRLPLLPGAALAPQEPRAAARGTCADPGADGNGDPAGLLRGGARGTSTGSGIELATSACRRRRSSPASSSPKELRGLYELATALVFPSRFEGWGLPVCEAFSAGLPVASSTSTGLPDLVGDAGLTFDPESTEQIADAAERLWTDERLRLDLAERGRKRSELFSWDRTARLFRAHYRRIGGQSLAEEDRILLAAPPPA